MSTKFQQRHLLPEAVSRELLQTFWLSAISSWCLTYQQLLKDETSILEDAGSRLKHRDRSGRHIKADILPDTQIIQVKVQDKNASASE
jgi:hypothetical protein